jgi:hypothetical protein
LAEIYAAQGHIARAIDTIESVLVREPDHELARAFLARLKDASYPRAGVLPGCAPEVQAPLAGGLGGGEVHEDHDGHVEAARSAAAMSSPGRPLAIGLEGPSSDVDECIGVRCEPRSLFVYWALRFRTMEYLVGRSPDGAAVLRVVVLTPHVEGAIRDVRDSAIAGFVGDTMIRDLASCAVVRVAVGWKSSAGTFHPAANSPALQADSADRSMWDMEAITRSTASGLSRIDRADKDASAILRALAYARRGRVHGPMGRLDADPPDVATVERWIYAPAAWSVPTE